MTWSDESHFMLSYVDGQVHLCHILGEEMAPEFTTGRRHASGGNVMLLPMFC